jgi:dihydrofolate reductase
MTADAPRVTVHVVSSLDGFIASQDGGVSWLELTDTYEKGSEGEDPESFLRTVNCFVMGARTYEQALGFVAEFGWPYGDVPTFVLTHRDLPAGPASVTFQAGDLTAFVNDTLKPRYRNIWVVGGAALIQNCLRLRLADEIRLTVAPILLSEGLPLFERLGHEQALHLKDVTAYKNGMVELWYEVRAG